MACSTRLARGSNQWLRGMLLSRDGLTLTRVKGLRQRNLRTSSSQPPLFVDVAAHQIVVAGSAFHFVPVGVATPFLIKKRLAMSWA